MPSRKIHIALLIALLLAQISRIRSVGFVPNDVQQPIPKIGGTLTTTSVADSDAFVSNYSDTTNFGSDDYFKIGFWNHVSENTIETFSSFFHFNHDDKPNGVTDAELRFYLERVYRNFSIKVELIETSWNEETITWSNKPSATEVISECDVIGNETSFLEIDITDYVDRSDLSVKMSVNFTQYMTDHAIIDYLSGWTREGSTIYPQLVWTYETPFYIEVTKPKKDDELDFGYHTIKWEWVGHTSHVIIELYDDGTLERIIEARVKNDGEYEAWRIEQANNYSGNKYQIKITDYYNRNLFGWSDKFNISITKNETESEDTSWMIWTTLVAIGCMSGVAIVVVIVKIKKKGKGKSVKQKGKRDSDHDLRMDVDF